jgi:hypothetical protein
LHRLDKQVVGIIGEVGIGRARQVAAIVIAQTSPAILYFCFCVLLQFQMLPRKR